MKKAKTKMPKGVSVLAYSDKVALKMDGGYEEMTREEAVALALVLIKAAQQ